MLRPKPHPARNLLSWGIVFLASQGWGCASSNPSLGASRLPNGSLQVKGPLAGPYPSLEELAHNACDLMTRQPGASNGLYGFEYCALNYFSEEENAYFLSYLSSFREKLDSLTAKTCSMPTSLDDPSHPDAVIIGFNHTHPHNRAFSKPDLSAWIRWSPARFGGRRSKGAWDPHLMLFYRERTGECRTYVFNLATRIVAALREGHWVPIGEVYTAEGDIRMFDHKDWLP
jgi:hypothetical protein